MARKRRNPERPSDWSSMSRLARKSWNKAAFARSRGTRGATSVESLAAGSWNDAKRYATITRSQVNKLSRREWVDIAYSRSAPAHVRAWAEDAIDRDGG